jgi:hypothetical protein
MLLFNLEGGLTGSGLSEGGIQFDAAGNIYVLDVIRQQVNTAQR